jgi:aminoglycoside phosphotransferase (APT) family kinase protein
VFPVDSTLARRLVDEQFPQWRPLPLSRLDPAGSDHVIYRLGRSLSVRFPRHPGAVGQAAKEAALLPWLAPRLPLAVPVPVAVGSPGFGYPWEWGVARWLPGSSAAGLGDSVEAARTLAGFLSTLQSLPVPADASLGADQPLAARDEVTRQAIADLADVFDAAALIRVWEQALEAPAWQRPPVWFHGDFHTGNLLTVDGRLSAVIDFGGLGVGDPAKDLQIAYTLLEPAPRAVFRAALDLDLDEATWARGRGWTLTGGLLAYRAYAAGDERIAAQTTRQITAALADGAGAPGRPRARPASPRRTSRSP